MFAWKNHGRSLGRIDGWWSDLLPEWLIRVRYQGLGPQPSLANTRCHNTGQDTFVLDNASALIDGHTGDHRVWRRVERPQTCSVGL